MTDLSESPASRPHEPRVLVFACRHCGLIGADRAGRDRQDLPAAFRLVPVECAAAVDPDLVLRALADGLDGVAVLGCHLGGCRFNDANHSAAKRLQLLRDLLSAVGAGPERLLTSWGTAHEPHQFVDLLQRFLDSLRHCPDVGGLRRGPSFTPGVVDHA